ncbi:MAG TPA: alpha/beta hydrolase fold domain-containing protein, partial [Capillimicrobium sp.]
MGLKHTAAHVTAMLVALLLIAAPAARAATPPGPPASGPGSEASLPWGAVKRVDHAFADAALNYSTFEPAGWRGAGAAPSSAPLVVFLHGYLGYDPKYYATWLDHIVRQGNVVVFPNYQAHALTPPRQFTDNAIWSVKSALPWLAANATVKPDTAQGMVLAGHSYGGVVSANLAARAAAQGLPRPRSLFLVMPWHQTIDTSLGAIPSTTKLLCVVGDNDTMAGRQGCDTLWDKTAHIPAANRNYVLMRSDAHGTPALDASHRVPSDADAAGFDALDWHGIWKLSDGLRNCALLGTDCRYALGNTWEQTFMGRWSDGTLVRQLWVYTTKPADPFPDARPPSGPAPAGAQAASKPRRDSARKACRRAARSMPGTTIDRARGAARRAGCALRVVSRHGEQLAVTD